MSTINAPRPHALDPGRITAGAGAIAVNGLLFMLLLVPIAAPPLMLRDEVAVPEIIWITRKQPEPEPVPVLARVRQPTPREAVEPRPVRQAMAQPSVDTTHEPQPGDIVVPPGDAAAIVAPSHPEVPIDSGEPLEGAHLEYASAAPPPYPREALVGNLTGTVMLQVLVDIDGKPLEVTVQRSSGHRVLDAAARRQVLSKWRFRPAMRNGVAVQAIGLVPVEFKLD